MKKISVINRIDDRTQGTEILSEHNAGSTIFEINDYGRDKLGATQEIVEAYTTRRSILTKDESIVLGWTFICCQTKLEVFSK
jgi:hypothetical protein